MMASFFPCFKHITASDIDSETATAGHVPTADGSGGTAWAAQSGGGASFAFDGATFSFGARSGGDQPFTLTLTKGGVAIDTNAVYFASISYAGNMFVSEGEAYLLDSLRGLGPLDSAPAYIGAYLGASQDIVMTYVSYDPEGESEITVYINIFLPDGSIITSAGQTFTYAD